MAESLGTPPQPLVSLPSPQYLAQVKAFLSYIEDVEVDEETIGDILAGLEQEEFDINVTSDGEQSGAEAGTPNSDIADDKPGEEEDEFAQEGQACWTLLSCWRGLFGCRV